MKKIFFNEIKVLSDGFSTVVFEENNDISKE